MNVIETNNLIKIYQQGDIEVKALNDVSKFYWRVRYSYIRKSSDK